MNKLYRIAFLLLAFLLCASLPVGANTHTVPEKESGKVIFRFTAGSDVFSASRGGNGAHLDSLMEAIDRHRADILSGAMPVYVDGYALRGYSLRTALGLAKIRSNRVKSELIVRGRLREEHFVTQNHAAAYEGLPDAVVVSIIIPRLQESLPPEMFLEEEEPVVAAVPKETAEEAPEKTVVPVRPVSGVGYIGTLRHPVYKGWYAGANLGLPFFFGDFTSTASDKTYIGISAGIYGGYQFNSWLGVSLSLDYAYNKAGHRGYAADFLLDPGGMTWYTPQNGTTRRYDELYGKINMFSVGLHAELNANRILGRRAARYPLKLIVSPALYANTFSSNVYTKSDNAKYVERNHSRSVSLGLGGDVMLRYDISSTFGVHLKGTGMWITDNTFDNILTVGKVKQNAMWGVSAGMILRFDNKYRK